MTLQRFPIIAAMLLCSTLAHAQQTVPQKSIKPLPFTGVSLAGGEFDNPQPNDRPIYGQKYIYPSSAEMGYFAGKGANVIRFPFHWMDLQPALNQPLDPVVLGRIQDVVKAATGKGQIVILEAGNSWVRTWIDCLSTTSARRVRSVVVAASLGAWPAMWSISMTHVPWSPRM